MGRWCWGSAGGCCAIRPTPTTRFKRRFCCSRCAPRGFASRGWWETGCLVSRRARRWALAVRLARRIAQEKRLMRFLDSKQRSETDDADLRMTIDEQIHRLPEKLRRVVVCYHLQGLTTREAAEQLNWPESTVMARLKQARKLLKDRLSRKGLSVSEASMGAVLAAVALPPLLRASAAQAGAAVVAGKVSAGAAVSGKAAAMAKGTAKALFITKAKIAAAVVVSVVTLGGAAAMTRQAAARGNPAAGCGRIQIASRDRAGAARQREPVGSDQSGLDDDVYDHLRPRRDCLRMSKCTKIC